MPAFMSPTFNPARLMLGQHPTQPYVSTQGNAQKAVPQPQQAPPRPQSTILGAQAVRATGQGPFDPSYRQDLATYAGGNFQRPNGFLGFNPTGALFGNPVGGGNAPVQGMPTDLLTGALGGQAFGQAAPQPPPTQPAPKKEKQQPGDWRFWLNRQGEGGRMLRNY